jgi:hypothetical protein
MILPGPGSHLSWQQLLAAYADGHLDEATRERVRSLVEAHPSARRELDDQTAFSPRRLELWNELRPFEPSSAAWAGVWERIELSLEAPRVEVQAPKRQRGLIAALVAVPCSAAAAAVVIGFSGSQPVKVDPIVEEPTPEVFEVAAASDVEILSVRDRDAKSLVVGEPPLNGEMPLVARGDVTIEHVHLTGTGASPDAQPEGPTDAPLVYSPKPRMP